MFLFPIKDKCKLRLPFKNHHTLFLFKGQLLLQDTMLYHGYIKNVLISLKALTLLPYL